MRAAVIVAHPDDEVIWCGGYMLQNPSVHWTVLSLCRGDDADRRPKFERVVHRLGGEAIISDLDDGCPLGEIDVPREIGGRIISLLGERRWDLVLTHGPNGEYGHERHRQTHAEVVRLARQMAMNCRSLLCFAYDCQAASGECRPADWADRRVELTGEQLAAKKELITSWYGYAADSFECRACISPEAFKDWPLEQYSSGMA